MILEFIFMISPIKSNSADTYDTVYKFTGITTAYHTQTTAYDTYTFIKFDLMSNAHNFSNFLECNTFDNQNT